MSAVKKSIQGSELIKGLRLKSAFGVFWVVLSWVALSHAEPLSSQGTSNYFSSNLSEPVTFSNQRLAQCERDCPSEKILLAKRTRKKASARKVSTNDPYSPKLNTDYFLGILSDTKYIFLSPLRWNGSDWLKAALVLGTTGAFFTLDDEIRDFVQDERNETTDDIAEVFEPFGNGGYTFTGLVAFYIYGHFAENEKAMRAALLSVESFAVTGIFTFALKFSSGRTRPGSAQNSREWSGFDFDNVSFPSGHTSSAFAIATVLASEYENQPLVPPILYSLATLTGLSRINDNKHWASDVFLGGALGYFVSKTILKLHSNKKGRHYTIYPRISKKEVGLDFAMRF
jgi:membrane-associated phospholipid phosphatase